MLCSKCSELVRPVVAIDIDGTLAMYHEHFLMFMSRYVGRAFRNHDDDGNVIELYDGSEPFRDWSMRAYEIDLRTWQDIKLAYRQGAQKRSMPAFRYASDLVRNIRGHGAEVWIATSRPYLRLDNIDPDTRAWLSRNNIVFDHLLYGDDKYRSLSEQVDGPRVVAVLDDLPEMYDNAAAVFGAHVPILRKQHYNRSVYRVHMAESLEAACTSINLRIKNWKETNG